MVKKSLEVAEMLKERSGIECKVIDLRTLRLLDIDIVLNSLEKTIC